MCIRAYLQYPSDACITSTIWLINVAKLRAYFRVYHQTYEISGIVNTALGQWHWDRNTKRYTRDKTLTWRY
jgi:hypothetical protein